MCANVACDGSYVSECWDCGAIEGYTSRKVGFSCDVLVIFCPQEISLHTLLTGSVQSEPFGIYQENRVFF